MGTWITVDSLHLVSHDEGTVEQGLFGGVHVPHHNFEERVERDNFHGELISIGLFHLGKLEWVDAVGRAKGKVNISTADSA